MTFLILFGILLDLHTICLGCLHGSHNVYTVASRKSLFTLININIWCWGVIFSVELPFLISDSVCYLVLSVLPFHFKIKRISKILVFFFFQNLLNKSFFFAWIIEMLCLNVHEHSLHLSVLSIAVSLSPILIEIIIDFCEPNDLPFLNFCN